MGATTALRRTLKARFFRFLVAKGFVADLRNQPTSTVFRRRLGSRVQIVGVQWEKYGKPRFAVHFGTCPAEGLQLQDGVRSPDDILPTWCPDTGSLQPGRGLSSRAWFRQDSTVMQRLRGQPALRSPDHVVEELLALFPQLERYWTVGEVGPHVRLWRFSGRRRSQGAPDSWA